MRKLLKLIRGNLVLSKFKIITLVSLLFIAPTKATASDFNNSSDIKLQSGVKPGLENPPNARLVNVRYQSSKLDNGKIIKISRIKPFIANSNNLKKFVSRPNSGIEIYAYTGLNSPILIDNQEFESKLTHVKSMVVYAKMLPKRHELLTKVEIGNNLFRSAEDYYSENKIKPVDPQFLKIKHRFNVSNVRVRPNNFNVPGRGLNILALRMGRLCEDEGTRFLQAEFNEFNIPIKSLEPPISIFFKSVMGNYPYIYSKYEWPYSITKTLVNSENETCLANRIEAELETMPLGYISFDPELNFFDFNTIWFARDMESSCINANHVIFKASKKYEIKLTRKKGFFRNLFRIRKFSIPTKRELRDACVDGITQFFKFKKWMHKNVQRPLTNFIRSKTGNLFLASPHLQPFRRKYGFVNFDKHFTPVDIKFDRLESLQYRWQHYNKIEFNSDDNFLLAQCLENSFDSAVLLPQSNFVSLPLKFSEAEFTPGNLFYLPISKSLKNRKNSFNKHGFNSFDILIPQTSVLHIPNGTKTTNPEVFVFSRILNYHRKYIAMRNAKACRSWRYNIFYHRVAQEIMDETKLSSNNSIPPTFFIGPLLLKEKGIEVNGTCGYGLGYRKVGANKFYINPVTGLISIYQNSNHENFCGDDETTYFGVFKGRGYYSDKTHVKYFYVENFDDALFAYVSGQSSVRNPIKSRKNPFYWKREYYLDTEYLKIKKLSGPWHDIRTSVRDQFEHLYEIQKDVHFDIVEKPKVKGGVKLKFNSKIVLRNKKFVIQRRNNR